MGRQGRTPMGTLKPERTQWSALAWGVIWYKQKFA
jgi:hypothetical protein